MNKSQSWAGTVTYSNESGATVEVAFTGSSVSVRGAYTPVGTFHMSSRYTLDGRDPPVQFDPPEAVTKETFSVYFYSSGAIPYGQHVLLIENLGEQFWLDSIVVGIPNNVSAASEAAQSPKPTTTTTLSEAPLSTSTSVVFPGTSTANTSETSPNAMAKSSVVVPGVAAGAAVGGTVVLVAILSGGLVWWRRRRRGNGKPDREGAVPGLTPYVSTGTTESRERILPSRAKGGSVPRPLGEPVPDLGSGERVHTFHNDLSSHEPRESDCFEPNSYTPVAEKPATFDPSFGPHHTDSSGHNQGAWRGSMSRPRSPETTTRGRSLDAGLHIAGAPRVVHTPPATQVPSPVSTLPPIYDLYQ
ncbi:hypothetical protein C8Q73DRAFT_538498 [Cubamyces lactineus]|nr:hypothetical protein C8Q73DRAFT_538498 [Cubamyces lactineus]